MVGIGRTLLGASTVIAALIAGCSEDPSESDERATGGSGGMGAASGGSNAGNRASGGSGNETGGSGGDEPGGAGGATGGDAGSATGGTAGGATGGSAGLEDCNALDNSADLVTSRVIEDDPPMPPMPEGGALVDGVYEITAVDIYDVTGTAMLDSRRRTVQLRYGGTIWDWVAEEDGVVSRVQAFYEAVDTELFVTTLCSTGATLSPRYGYTASAERILTFNTDNLGRVTVNTFTRR